MDAEQGYTFKHTSNPEIFYSKEKDWVWYKAQSTLSSTYLVFCIFEADILDLDDWRRDFATVREVKLYTLQTKSMSL